MGNCFQKIYAKYYDLIYKDKDYEKECDYLEEIFKKFLKKRPKTILDLACGTGGHAIPLVKRGYKVTGIDVSEAMLEIAQKKARDNNQKIEFYVDRIQNFKISKKFDIVISMFSTIDYITNYLDLKKLLLNIKSYLKKGGLFIFDFWNGFAVIDHFSPYKIKTSQDKGIKVIRVSRTKIEPLQQLALVNFECYLYNRNTLMDRFKETHKIRFYFPHEIENYLKIYGFEVLESCPFLKLNKKINFKKDWDITLIAKFKK